MYGLRADTVTTYDGKRAIGGGGKRCEYLIDDPVQWTSAPPHDVVERIGHALAAAIGKAHDSIGNSVGQVKGGWIRRGDGGELDGKRAVRIGGCRSYGDGLSIFGESYVGYGLQTGECLNDSALRL